VEEIDEGNARGLNMLKIKVFVFKNFKNALKLIFT
jgi:hypothetical protein